MRLNATMTQNVVTYTVEVNTDNTSGKLLPYLTANVKFETGQRGKRPDGAERCVALDADARAEGARSARGAPASGRATADASGAERRRRPAKDSADGGQRPRRPARRTRARVWVPDGDLRAADPVRVGLSDG